MRGFVAGQTGAIGSKLATPPDPSAVHVVADALDPDQFAEAVTQARLDVIVHQLTAIGAINPRRFDRDFAPTNNLRIEGIRPPQPGWLPRQASWPQRLVA